MNNLATPIILIILSAGLFFTFTDKQYQEVKALQESNKQYTAALDSWKELLAARDKLNDQFNAIDPLDLDRLQKMVPDNIDNVRLIIEMNGILQSAGLPARNIKVETEKNDSSKVAVTEKTKNYNSASLSFDVTTTYANFERLLHELQSSLRVLDITNIALVAGDKEPYQYTFTIKTYWMK